VEKAEPVDSTFLGLRYYCPESKEASWAEVCSNFEEEESQLVFGKARFGFRDLPSLRAESLKGDGL
jgi:hypothetical protein